MGRITIDETHYPLYLVVHEGVVSDEQFAEYLLQMRASMYRPDSGPRLILQDGRASTNASPKQRRMQADWIKQNEDRIREVNVGTAFVVGSPLVKGALTAALWLQRLPMPHIVVTSLGGALDWGEGILARHGLSLAPGTREAVIAAHPPRAPSLRPSP